MPIPETVTRNSDAATDDWVTTISGDVGDEEEGHSLVVLMESLAIQTAVSVVEKAIDEQATRIRNQARRLFRRRNNDEET
jgi:hypothetical protein